MRQIKILKNVSQNVVTVMGREFAPGESKEILPHLFLELMYNSDMKSLVSNGTIVVNNGIQDLQPTDGVIHLERLVDPWDESQIPIRRCLYFPFCYVSVMDYTQYLVSWVDNDTRSNRLKRSGDLSNGFKYDDSCPIVCPFAGRIVSAYIVCKGAAVSTGTPSSSVNFNFEVWDVGFAGEGSKISDLIFPIQHSVNPVGKWWNTYGEDTHLKNSISLDIDVFAGNMLALKFVRKTGNDDVVAARGVLVGLTVLENL